MVNCLDVVETPMTSIVIGDFEGCHTDISDRLEEGKIVALVVLFAIQWISLTKYTFVLCYAL